MELPNFDFLKFNDESAIPIPDHEKDIPITVDHIAKLKAPNTDLNKNFGTKFHKKQDKLHKHEREYDAYCQWYALPPQIRKPKTAVAFEKKWKIPQGYTIYFLHRDDFKDRCARYFWEWVRSVRSEFVYEMYKLAISKKNPAAIKFFSELIARDLDVDKPQQMIQPFMMIGVPQEKIDALFTPPGVDKIEDVIPIEEASNK